MENLTENISPSHQRLAEIFADRSLPDIRIDALKFVFGDVSEILGRNLVQELNQKAEGKNKPSFILDIGCGQMGVGKTLKEIGLDEKIKWVGIDINNYGLEPTPPYSKIILGDITSEETLNCLQERFGNEKILAIFGIGLPPEIVKELIELKDNLIALLDEQGIILFIADYDPKPNKRDSEFKLFKGNYPSDPIIFYYQKTTLKKEG